MNFIRTVGQVLISLFSFKFFVNIYNILIYNAQFIYVGRYMKIQNLTSKVVISGRTLSCCICWSASSAPLSCSIDSPVLLLLALRLSFSTSRVRILSFSTPISPLENRKIIHTIMVWELTRKLVLKGGGGGGINVKYTPLGKAGLWIRNDLFWIRIQLRFFKRVLDPGKFQDPTPITVF